MESICKVVCCIATTKWRKWIENSTLIQKISKGAIGGKLKVVSNHLQLKIDPELIGIIIRRRMILIFHHHHHHLVAILLDKYSFSCIISLNYLQETEHQFQQQRDMDNIFIMISQQPRKSVTNQPFIHVGSYRYRESDILGSGYESKVYKATHTVKRNEVALKMIELDKIEDGIHKRLLDSELQCLQALKGTPHIINLLDVVKTEKILYVVTQLCRGDLSVKDNQKIPQEEAQGYLKQLLKGYKSLYDKGILHRDLKPQNMFKKSQSQIKIGDFGFAATFAQAKRQSNYNIGSPSYMAPEVLNRNDYSYASDIWSIGVTYFQLAVGKLPWHGENQQQIMAQITTSNIQKIIEKSRLSESSKQFLRKTLCIQASQRIKGEDLFNYKFNEAMQKSISQKNSFDKYSSSTAETPRNSGKKYSNFLNQEDFLFIDPFNKSVQQMKPYRQTLERHSRRMSFDTNMVASNNNGFKVPEQKPIRSEKIIGSENSSAFKKKYRASFDVAHEKKILNEVKKFSS